MDIASLILKNNILEVYDAVKSAKQKAQKGLGPTLIEAVTFRMRGHEEASGTDYISKKILYLYYLDYLVFRLGVKPRKTAHRLIFDNLKKKIKTDGGGGEIPV